MTMCQFNNKSARMTNDQTASFLQTYSLKKGLNNLVISEILLYTKKWNKYMIKRCLNPFDLKMTQLERKRALKSLIFLLEKRDRRVKGHTCANGITQGEYIMQEEAASPKAATEAIPITEVIEDKQRRDIMTWDIQTVFVQTPNPLNGDKVMIKFRGPLCEWYMERNIPEPGMLMMSSQAMLIPR